VARGGIRKVHGFEVGTQNVEVFYVFDYGFNQYEALVPMANYSPGETRRVEQELLYNWDGHSEHVAAWVRNLVRELEAPDLWSDAGRLAAGGDEIDRNEPFSPDELHVVREQLQTIRAYVKATYDLNSAQAAMLDKRLTYLEAAAGRVGRFDWRGLAVSVVFNIAWDLAFTSTQAREFVAFVASALGSLVQSLPRLPY
jgi:hypothetical protein